MNDNEAIQYFIKRDLFWSKLNHVVGNNDLDQFKEIMTSQEFKIIPHYHKEYYAFYTSYINFKDKHNDILIYLIFDYNISESNSIDKISVGVVDTVKQMFESRKINIELNQELIENFNPNKKTKV
jgi:hypothetical protein